MIIYTSKTSAQIRQLAWMLSVMLTGRAPSLRKYADGIKAATAYQFFSLVHDAFLVKSGGGTDEAGYNWKPLSPAYLAYQRRFGKGEQAALKKEAGIGRGNSRKIGNGSTLLNKQQADLWWSTYARAKAIALQTLPVRDAKSKAAAIAWSVVKKAGGKTKLEVYGHRRVDILRDTGVLLNSLTPGVVTGNHYQKPPPRKQGGQVARIEPASLSVGTNVKYAGAHHNGYHVPMRRLWPDASRMPQRWKQLINQRMQNGFTKAVYELAS